MLSLSQFKQVVALSEHGSFTLAAEAVGLSHSALSQTLTRLEEHYGVLFSSAWPDFCLPLRGAFFYRPQGRVWRHSPMPSRPFGQSMKLMADGF